MSLGLELLLFFFWWRLNEIIYLKVTARMLSGGMYFSYVSITLPLNWFSQALFILSVAVHMGIICDFTVSWNIHLSLLWARLQLGHKTGIKSYGPTVEVVFLLAASIASPTASVSFQEGQPPWQGSQDVVLASFPLVFLMRSLNCPWMVTVSSLQVNTCPSPVWNAFLYLPQLACNSAIHKSPSPTPAPWLPSPLPFHLTLFPGFSKDVLIHGFMVTLCVLVPLIGYDTPGKGFPLPLSCQ